ncbi:MAG TPA: DUF6600 domain-containing protein [Chthoniobacterales bacterium]
MNKIFPILLLSVFVSLVACQKQQTDEERRAEIDREVQQRLATERQQAQTQQLDQRAAELNAREQALRQDRENAATTREGQDSRSDLRATGENRTSSTRDSEPSGSYSIFYSELEPYGDWLETRDYGYVYRPREAASSQWRPYANGRWVYTDAGWTWISDEPFGWATYHYGRWTRIRGIGWIWVPGDEWAPAWVSWRKGGEYVGWAPLPPEARFDHRHGIHNWSDSYYDVGPDQYVFVRAQQLGEQRMERAILPEQQNATIVNQTTNVTKITYANSRILNEGPSYDELKAQSRIPIQRLRLERQAGIQANEERPIVRGEVVQFPAPVIAPARGMQRPRTVKQTIAQASVDLGWGAIDNTREAEQLRAKIKAEATPPTDAPPKKFVRPTETSGATIAASPPATATSRTASAAPGYAEKPEVTSRPAFTPRAIDKPMITPLPSTGARAATTVAPPTATVFAATPEARPPALTPSAPSLSATPNASSSVAATTPGQETSVPPAAAQGQPLGPAPDERRRKFKSIARQLEKQSVVPMPSATISPAPSATPGESSASPDDRRKGLEHRFPVPSNPTTSPSAPNNPNSEAETRKERKRLIRAGAANVTASPSSSPSTAPER